MKTVTTRGFTLIEMISVIAIIGILTSVVIANYAPARQRAQTNAAITSLESVRAAAAMCAYRLSNLNARAAGSPICAQTNVKWPALTGGWTYGGCFDADVSDRTFSYCAVNGAATITCTDAVKCTQS